MPLSVTNWEASLTSALSDLHLMETFRVLRPVQLEMPLCNGKAARNLMLVWNWASSKIVSLWLQTGSSTI